MVYSDVPVSKLLGNLHIAFSINYFSQPHAQLDHFHRLDWLHVLYVIDDPFSHAMKVECVFRAQEQP